MRPMSLVLSAVIPRLAPLDALSQEQVRADCIASACRQLARAPLYVRLPAAFLALVFALFALGTMARYLSALTDASVERLLERFSRLSASLAVLERVSRSLVLLAYFEHPIVLRALGETDLAARQSEFRSRRAALVEVRR